VSWPSGLNIARGIADGNIAVHKFGRNDDVGTTIMPITASGVYRMPLPADAQRLRVRSGGDANDTAGGSGTRSIRIQGLAVDGTPLDQDIDLAGASASALTDVAFLRSYRVAVLEVGTYEIEGPASAADSDIIIEDAAGNEWCRISQATDFQRGQGEIGCYSVPMGYSLYISKLSMSTDVSAKTDFFVMQRQGILDGTGAEYRPFRMVQEFRSLSGLLAIDYDVPIGPIRELTDVLVLARATSGTVDVQVQLDFILVHEAQPDDATVLRN
jgi:hypothetical protein